MENLSVISHISIPTNHFDQAKNFYTQVLATLECKIIMEHPGAIAFGKQFPEVWVQTPHNQEPAQSANGVHFAFLANSQEQVNAFYKKALELGAKDDGKPGPRPMYGEPYYGCFFRDLDGHKIEAMFWNE